MCWVEKKSLTANDLLNLSRDKNVSRPCKNIFVGPKFEHLSTKKLDFSRSMRQRETKTKLVCVIVTFERNEIHWGLLTVKGLFMCSDEWIYLNLGPWVHLILSFGIVWGVIMCPVLSYSSEWMVRVFGSFENFLKYVFSSRPGQRARVIRF